MLRRLRRQMVLLNACISGAILLTMAFVALRVSEDVLSSQYERDLERNAAQMMITMSTATAGTQVQFASNYTLYQESDGKALMIGTQGEETEDIAQVARQAREEVLKTHKIYTDTVVHEASETSPSEKDILHQRIFISTYSDDPIFVEKSAPLSENTENAAYLPKRIQMLPFTSTFFVTADDASYRVMVPVINTEAQPVQMLMILQNRTEELKALRNLRWLFFSCALGGLLLTGAASLYLSSRSIRPVEQSIKRQHEFVAAASHELRTPVAAVRANAEVLQDAPLGEYAPYLQSIEQESERMTHLVSDLMNLARADADGLSLKSEPVELAGLASQTLDVMHSLADKKGIKLTQSVQNALIKGDAARLQQALMALLDNALRYTPAGGTVRLITEKSGIHAIVRVIDNGPGIPAEHKPRVFDRFYRIAPERSNDGGCGLGLSVARQLVERMGGSISLSDAPGGGCVFELKFRALKQ